MKKALGELWRRAWAGGREAKPATPAQPAEVPPAAPAPVALAMLPDEQVAAVLRGLGEAGRLNGRTLPPAAIFAGFEPEWLPHLVHAMQVAGTLAGLNAQGVVAITHALKQAGHRLTPTDGLRPTDNMGVDVAGFAPEWLPHLVHAMQVAGTLAGLNPQGVAAITHALKQAGHRLTPADGPRATVNMNIDVVGTCNLRCPSCPVGTTGAINPSGLMKPALFEKIILKAKKEYPLDSVYLFNWTEPLLHPELPALISFVRQQQLSCGVSSNLNNMKNIDRVIAARPTAFRISLSGFTQETYRQTHAGGDVERVKKNMAALSQTLREQGNRETAVQVYYHKYRHNIHEAEPMRQYAESLGFEWTEDWAYLMPVEKCLDLIEDRLPEEERLFAERQFALPMREAMAAAKQVRDRPCPILPDLTIDVQGYLALCCATYDSKGNRLGFFLDMTPEQIASAKSGHSLCGPCGEQGLHAYVLFDQIPALRNVYDYLAHKNLAAPEAAPRRASLPLVRERPAA